MRRYEILRVVTRVLLPFILIYALYVQFHGDFGPGGGFQAGVIFAVGLILYGLVFGLRSLRDMLPESAMRLMMAAGLLLYAGVGIATMALGGAYLDYNVLSGNSQSGQHLGIFLVEFGVGVTVCGVVVAIFDALADYPDSD